MLLRITKNLSDSMQLIIGIYRKKARRDSVDPLVVSKNRHHQISVWILNKYDIKGV